MDENNIKLDFSEIDKLLQKLADDKSFEQGDLFDDNNLITSTASASTISTVAGNTWPYPNSSSGSYTWTTNDTGGYNLGTNIISPSLNLNDTWKHGDAKLKVQGDAEFEGDVKIKGKSIAETLDKIEARLAILHPNEKLEAKWEELKALGDAYRTLEKDILEKEKIWETLKK
jgi:hypothetical protein